MDDLDGSELTQKDSSVGRRGVFGEVGSVHSDDCSNTGVGNGHQSKSRHEHGSSTNLYLQRENVADDKTHVVNEEDSGDSGYEENHANNSSCQEANGSSR